LGSVPINLQVQDRSEVTGSPGGLKEALRNLSGQEETSPGTAVLNP
jgi:hypothetical protein